MHNPIISHKSYKLRFTRLKHQCMMDEIRINETEKKGNP